MSRRFTPSMRSCRAPSQDYDEARRLLAEAGFGDGLDISIDCVAQPTWEPNTCQVISQMLVPAGINLSVNVMPGGTYWDRWLVAPFGFTSWTHRPLGITVLNLAYRSGVPWNETGYANPEFDTLLDQANGTFDVDARREIVRELELMLQGDAILIQPYWRSIHTASRTNVHGYHLAARPRIPLRRGLAGPSLTRLSRPPSRRFGGRGFFGCTPIRPRKTRTRGDTRICEKIEERLTCLHSRERLARGDIPDEARCIHGLDHGPRLNGTVLYLEFRH